MTTEEMGKIIDRIRKLHAKAESAKAIGSLEEAATFAAAVEKMLMKYKLSQATLSFDEKEAEDPLGAHWMNWDDHEGLKTNKRRISWIEKLTGIIADAHFCNMIVSKQSSNIMIVGRQQDRAVAEYMCVMLVRLGIDLADKAYRKKRYDCWKAGNEPAAHGFREAFLFGYVTRLRERYAEMRAEEIKNNGAGVSLVVQRSKEEVTKWMQETLQTKKVNATQLKAKIASGGVEAGRKAADAVNLKGGGLAAGRTDPTSALTKGQRLLGGGDA